MKIWLIFWLLYGAAFASDFITKNEYARMLYQNPRGIGCDKCHGSGGEGSLISKYRHFDKKTKQIIDDELRAPRINNLDFETFKEGVLSARSVMPSYFLTDEEINLLYEYVINFNKDKK